MMSSVADAGANLVVRARTDARARRAIVSVISVVAVVALGYSGAPFTLVLVAIGLMTLSAWLQDDRHNILMYVALLGVQVAVPDTGIALPFRLAVADFFLLPVIVRLL